MCMDLEQYFVTDSNDEQDFSCTIELLAAVGRNGVIGNNNTIPWHYPEDLERFKVRTMGHKLVMGRKTHESIVGMNDGLLTERTHIVLTSQSAEDISYGTSDSVVLFDNIESLITYLTVSDPEDEYYVVGGESVYRQLLPYATHISLTYVPESPDGDTYFPEFNPLSWEVVAKSGNDESELQFVTYKRRF